MYHYEYPRPALTVDCIIFNKEVGNILEILLIERAHEPFAGCWALPGGFVDENEDLEAAALRELFEETNLEGIALKQLHTFGTPKRDPRGHIVSVVYYGIAANKANAQAASDAKRLAWFNTNNLPSLAFDHQQIIEMALQRLRSEKL